MVSVKVTPVYADPGMGTLGKNVMMTNLKLHTYYFMSRI